MNNEIGRKITSLTLMTIMIAGGLTFAVPGVMPAAHAANANLFVSAENSQFDNYMSGPQVIEVVVIDSTINETDEAKGEPDVTVNGKDLRMVQAVDGNWYGYFADRRMAQIADSTVPTALQTTLNAAGDSTLGLNFGQFCSAASGSVAVGINVGDTNGIAVPGAPGAAEGSPSGATITATCTGQSTGNVPLNVLREAKDINQNVPGGQITNPANVVVNAWPFVQLYTLNPTGNVVVQYNKGGGVQTTTLTFDTVDQFAGAELDRTKYPRGSEVHTTITDLWLNIDPTDEDSWTFGTVGNVTTIYQVFDENGGQQGDSVDGGLIDISGTLPNLMCEDNCVLRLDPRAQGNQFAVTLQSNDDSDILATTGAADPQVPTSFQTAGEDAGTHTTTVLAGNVPITITEQGPNSGVFGTYDESDTSVIVITDLAVRGTSASIDYNETPRTILIGLDFATIDIQPTDDEWNSGEEIPIVVVDGDANKNSRADEDLDLNNPAVDLLPALKTGQPLTLASSSTTLSFVTVAEGTVGVTKNVQAFSEIARAQPTGNVTIANGDDLLANFGTAGNLLNSVHPQRSSQFQGFYLLNYDVRSIDDNASNVTTVDITVNASPTPLVFNNQPLQGLIALNQNPLTPNVFGPATTPLTVNFNFDSSAPNAPIATGTILPVVVDFFAFGYIEDGEADDERVANQIVRLELEESGDNTSTFVGSLEYTMINQLNILDKDLYEGLDTISDEVSFIVIEDLDDEESPRVTYFDRGADGTDVQVSDQQEAPSHSGIVSLSSNTFKVGDTVTITLEDQDLNVDSDLIDIYTTVTDSSDPVFGAVGEAGLPVLPFGPLGRVLDVTFDDLQWVTSQTCTPVSIDTGLDAVSFSLIETDRESGVFIGDFAIPQDWCRPGATSPESTTGLDFEVNYVDFRDASGEIVEVGDSAGIRANTGSVSLDRTVYPVPFGVPANFAGGDGDAETTPSGRSVFPIHQTGIEAADEAGNDNITLDSGEFLRRGDLTVHVRVNDPDFDVSASGEDKIAQNRADRPVGPVKLSVIRGSETVILGFAGGPATNLGRINVGNTITGDGMIAASELSKVQSNTGFANGNVTITQSGVANANQATGTFTSNDIPGAVQQSELAILNNVNGQTSPLTVFISDGVSVAQATFTDLNGDTNVDNNELSSIGTTPLVNGPVTVSTSSAAVPAPATVIANATFTDAPNTTLELAELAVTNGGSTFVNGQVTIRQGAVTATATFTDDVSGTVRSFGPMDEIAPDAGIFEADIILRYTDGPADPLCPQTTVFTGLNGQGSGELNRFTTASPSGENYCILQGDILQVEYTDPTDASGDVNTVTDSATFDLRNGVLQSDKSVYIIGSDMILTLIEPDLDLDNDQAETWDLDLIEWDSDAATVTMGDEGDNAAAFDPEPSDFRETGDSTGIFQIVIEIPEILDNDRLERGEEIVLEYTDWGPSGADYVGEEDEDVNLTLYTSNFGATVELDQKVYSWTDKVYITIVAPDHNFDSDLVDDIGNTDLDPIKVSTRGKNLDRYKLVETGTDTGIFTGEVILTGFATHDADGDGDTGDATGITGDGSGRTNGIGPTNGFLSADDDDGITVSFEFSEDETVVGSALIRWNIGEVQWLEASYPATGTGVVRIIDPDMNLDPEAVDNFNVDVWSDSDAGGIDLTVTETNEATGIFEGTVFFTVNDESSGHRLRVAEGDTVTAEYEDNTLPDPYTTADELDITATSLIGTVVPPLERAPASNLRVVDAFGNSLDAVKVDQQVQITADLANGQDREQAFAYLVQIQDSNGVTVSLAWITGSLSPGQSFSPALSWIPTAAGTYTATAFVWESVDNPTALSPPVTTTVTVS